MEQYEGKEGEETRAKGRRYKTEGEKEKINGKIKSEEGKRGYEYERKGRRMGDGGINMQERKSSLG